MGLDGVAGTSDMGEGNGRFDANPNLARWTESGAIHLLDQMPDDQLDRLNMYEDAGIRDFLLSGFATNWLWAALEGRATRAVVNDHLGFDTLPGASKNAFDFLELDFSPEVAGRHVYVRYGDPDADARTIRAGDGHHVGSFEQILQRLLFGFQSIDARMTEPDRSVVRDFQIADLIKEDS